VRGKWWEYLVPEELPRDAVGDLVRVGVGFAIGPGWPLPLGLWMGRAAIASTSCFNPIVQLLRHPAIA